MPFTQGMGQMFPLQRANSCAARLIHKQRPIDMKAAMGYVRPLLERTKNSLVMVS